MRDQSLLLLYATPSPVKDRDLFDWVEYSNFGHYKIHVLKAAHKSRLVEYDQKSGLVHLFPIGIGDVEGKLPLALRA
jgi:hypothetical protein